MIWPICGRVSPLLFIPFFLFARDREAPAQSRPSHGVLQVGERLKAFSLSTPEGKVLTSDALKGKVLLLDFWATWCAPCRKLTHEIDSTLAVYKDRKDIQLIGVDYNETPVSNNDPVKYWKDHGYGFPMTLNDTAYGNSIGAGNPTVLIVDREGVVRGRWDGRTAQTAPEIATLVSRLLEGDDLVHSTGMPVFPRITNTDIPGAPLLGEPMLITGTEREMRTEKHGLAYPAFYDWDHDGKVDLLMGEFETGQTGSDIKVYLNTGTNEQPRYTGKYFYATDVKGDTMTSYQWCCIGTHPRLVDLDQDGYIDILTGQYNPGQINWWRGTKDGFEPRQF
jgi:thiol-disulfide isomerase/thioredoxin